MNELALEEWLAATERALEAEPPERLEALARLVEERSAYVLELEKERAADGVPAELAARLRDAETRLAAVLDSERGRLSELLALVRRAREVAGGYRPAQANLPAFVSKSI